MSPPNPVNQLRCLDGSSPGFHERLSGVLYGEEYQEWIPNLDGDALVWLVDYLDKALDTLDPSTPGFRKCLRELRSICGSRGILPVPYSIPSHRLNVGPDPFASGGRGDVYEGTLDGSRVCIKRVRVYAQGCPEKATQAIFPEVVVWKHLTHPNILPLLGATIAPFQLVSNWMSGGDLPEYIKKNPNADRLGLLSDVAQGLRYLHSRDLIHGDLKGTNVLVDNSGTARIADFGFVAFAQIPDFTRSASLHHGHTARWAAPEVLNERTYSRKADVFSFAMVMTEVFTGVIPFSDFSSAMARLAIMQGKRPPRPTHPIFTDDLWALMQRCWDHHPHLRPEISEAVQILLTADLPTWKQLISNTTSVRERISLITTIFSDHNQVEMVSHLSGDSAQNFVDFIDEAMNGDGLPPEIYEKCLRHLRKICGHQALLPRSVVIPLCYDPARTPLYRGELGDLWKGQHDGREVSAKALRAYSASDLESTTNKFCREVVVWKALRHPNVLALVGATMSGNRLVIVSEWMENGNINDYMKARADVNRLDLLGDVARGLLYMHEQRIIHGNLKGTNVLIDNNGHACLADFGLLTIASERSTVTSSGTDGGSIRWMSPELIDPEAFGLKESRPTKESDCYALGTTIYEVLSGRSPFAPCSVVAVISKVLGGERPDRPQGEEGKLFTDALWRVVELCWKPRPRDRISARDVLLGLEGTPSPLGWSPDANRDVGADTEGQPAATANGFGPTAAHGDDGLPVPPHGYPKQGWVIDWLVRVAWNVFNAVTKQLHAL